METNYVNPHQPLKFVDESRIDGIDYADPTLEPVVSVVVPIFNASYTLDEALASLEVQTMDNIEIICVDDASTDRSRAIIDAHASRDGRYVVVSHARNCGYGASMNDGIAAARGQWIAILEPDDYVLPDMYEKLLATPAEVDATDVEIIKSPYIREIREDGVRRGDVAKTHLNCRYRGLIEPSWQPFSMKDPGVTHLLRHHPSIWSALYSTTFLAEYGLRFVEYPGSGWADNEFFYDTLLRARRIVYRDEPFYVYREETPAEFDSFARDRKLLRFERWQSMADIIEELGIDDEVIRASHVSKGFTYLGEQISTWGEDDPEVRQAMEKMFARMDPRLVEKERRVSPHLKKLYFEARGIPHRSAGDRPRYYRALAKEFVHTLRSNGIRYTADQVKQTIKRH
ncbi:glycosyltransferase [Anaerotardibacter muris]|uniref:glycosyltransferase n=1 Tax=Anaerotardibacter muris TaxID=2941505 RepID=UPI00203B8E5C|nr:glycosyltransferase family 2 protein [Anaerotardibacter muris]